VTPHFTSAIDTLGVVVTKVVPFPLSATLCGLVAVLSEIDRLDPPRAPGVFGVKLIVMAHVRPGASPPGGQVVPVRANSAGSLKKKPVMNSGFLPVFLTARFFVDVLPRRVLGKVSEAGTKIDVGVAPPTAKRPPELM
jgi:hypothetical protein